MLIVFLALLSGAFYFQSKYAEWFSYPPLRARINDQLKDPVSTQFRNERITKAGWMCGELNSRNGNGGYVGFKRYITNGSQENYLEGTGTIGEWSTADFIASLDKKNEILKSRIALYKQNSDITVPSSDRLDELAIEALFEDKWKQICTE